MKRISNGCTIFALVAFGLVGCNATTPETTDSVVANNPTEEPEAQPEKVEAPTPLDVIAEPTFIAFDLLQNRPLAHDVISGSYIAVSDRADFVKYSHGNHNKQWRLGLELDGVKAAVMNKARKATVWMPGSGKEAKSVSLRFYNPTKNPNEMMVTLNGQKLEPTQLEAGWQTVTFDAKGFAKTENTIEIQTSGMDRIEKKLSGGALDWISVGESIAPPERSVALEQGPLNVTSTHRAAWHIWGLEGSHLRVGFSGESACGVNAVFETGDGKKIEKSWDPVDGIPFPQTASMPLDELKDRVARVVLGPTEGCDEVKIEHAAIVMQGKQPEVPSVEPPELVLFWMIDTLRADHLPVDFKTDVEAPNLKRLAEEGASFSVAYVQGNESKTSHASLFSGMYPNRHKVVGKGSLKPHLEIMPEAIKSIGYNTGAYISNGYVSKPWGFVQGWDMYQNNLREGVGGIDGKRMAKTAIKWMLPRKGKKTFMYIGTIDPHVTYRRHEHLIEKYDPEPYKGRFRRACLGTDLGLIAGKKLPVNDRDKKRIHALYKNEITYNDEAFGWLRSQLEEAGMWEKTMVVVTADHGDQFWERGGVGHGSGVHQDQVHVPLILYYQPLIPKGTRVTAGVDVIDIYPTLVDVMGGERPKSLQGKSLLPLVHKTTGDYPEPAISTSYLSHYGLQMRQWKLYLKKNGYRLFDRTNDVLEKTDVASDYPLESRWLLDSTGWFRAHRGAWDKTKMGPASNLNAGFFEHLKEK